MAANAQAPRSGSRYGNQNRGGKRSRKRRRRGRQTGFAVLIVILLLVILCMVGLLLLKRYGNQKEETSQVSLDLTTLDSPFSALIDAGDGSVIAENNGDEIIYPASMTKIMTVLVAVESIRNLNKTVVMSADYYQDLYDQDATRAGFDPGEEATVRDLLYGALLPSGAECCIQLAIEAAGSEAAFADLMNQKAENLGLTKTHFTNTTGLHDDDQYTSCHEMALILMAALGNKTFRKVFTSASYTVSPTNLHPNGFTITSSFFKSLGSTAVTGGEILGGKTGFTQEAGFCLASAAEIFDGEYILVTAGWADTSDTSYPETDAVAVYNALGRRLDPES